MNEAPNTHKQNVTRRPSRESVRALATTAAAPHVCCVLCCMCVCCVVLLSPLWLLLCFWCGGLRASKYTGVPLSVSGYPATLFYPKTRPIPAGFGVMPESCLVLDWFSGFRLTGPNPTAHSTHTQDSTTNHHHQGIAHHTSHITHSTPQWIYVLRPPRRPEGAGNNAASSGQTLRYIVYIASDIYRCIGKILSR